MNKPAGKPLVVRDQVRLSPLRCLALTLAGIRFRLFRSLVTVAILALAVTFLAHGLSHTLIAHETRLLAFNELRHLREIGEWVARLRAPDPRGAVLARLASAEQPYVAEYRRWAGATAAEAAAAEKAARRLAELAEHLDALPEASRVILLGGREALDVLRKLADPKALKDFGDRSREMALPEPPGGLDALGRFAAGPLPKLVAYTDRVQAGHQAAVGKVTRTLGPRTPVQWFAAAADVRATLTAAGFHVDDPAVRRLRAAAEHELALAHVGAAMEDAGVAKALVRRLNVEPKELHVETVLAWLRSGGRADWLAGLIAPHCPADTAAPSGELLLAATRRFHRQGRLNQVVGAELPTARGGLFDLPTGTRWLMVLSFLVCAVGVTNAMFMSVTERFTEIATMKCLGALDGFLMLMFLFESALQGLLGSAIGIVLGVLVATGRGLASFGTMVFPAMPLLDLLKCAGLSLAAGLVLAVLAAVGPAGAVARLAPMEAMRID